MSFVGVEPAVMAATAANLLSSAVELQGAIFAATPAVTTVMPPAADPPSLEGAAAFNANNAQVLGMLQAHVAEMVSSAEAIGGAGTAYQIQDLIGKGLLLV
jgi:hypothetical protein